MEIKCLSDDYRLVEKINLSCFTNSSWLEKIYRYNIDVYYSYETSHFIFYDHNIYPVGDILLEKDLVEKYLPAFPILTINYHLLIEKIT